MYMEHMPKQFELPIERESFEDLRAKYKAHVGVSFRESGDEEADRTHIERILGQDKEVELARLREIDRQEDADDVRASYRRFG